MKTLTLQECKDAIAQKYERANWEVITQEMHKGDTDWIDMELMLTEAATLFAEQACEMQKVKCASVEVPLEIKDGLKIMGIMRDCILKCDNVITGQPLPAAPKV